ncbi:NrsF family protein [Qipengyuania marisflavi]|uniref:DUF1109 domain-containing protein n=1 Tax=Qipengyuania marisflavi TaxID=2486356 RepID=A0A5S3P375_9SPHN|nr:DUF1109 domain-containing protein [Qipengyuania marisflavi]TMM47278.1 DUF1109 domain-containing protein [Qipengyuania marisflavi]
MSRVNQTLIDSMVDDMQPVAPLRANYGWALVAAAAAIGALGVWLTAGLWRGGYRGDAEAIFYAANGMLLVLGAAASASAVVMASPGVGTRHDGPRWGMAMLAVLPLAAVVSALAKGSTGAILNDPYGLECMAHALVASSATAIALTLWLRRGAPVNPRNAGMLAGVAAGALGSAAYGLSCPIDTLEHLAIWHTLPVLIGGVVGRYAIARVLSW